MRGSSRATGGGVGSALGNFVESRMRIFRFVLLAIFFALAFAPGFGGGSGVEPILPWVVVGSTAILCIQIISASPSLILPAQGAGFLLTIVPIVGATFGDWPTTRSIGLVLLGGLQLGFVHAQGVLQSTLRFPDLQRTATEAMSRAVRAARTLRDDRIDTEHLLLGCLDCRSGDGTFAVLGVEPEELRHSVHRLRPPRPSHRDRTMFPFDPRCMRVLALAADRAEKVRNGDPVRIEDLIVGLFREGGGIAHRVLSEAGVTEEGIARLPPNDPANPDVFSDPARVLVRLDAGVGEIFRLAKEAALELRHDFIGELHLLLGLARAVGAAPAHRALGVDPGKLERSLLRTYRPRSPRAPADALPFAPEFLLALDRALGLAEARGSERIEVPDLLWALSGSREKRLVRALERAGFQPGRIAEATSRPPPPDEELHRG